ncbi:MAG: hypothetical protein HYV09_29055 [Deltaproteobacteria bacterium]|nr:hypothetical protein [Deltaproteobacteria bacterium]
MRMLIATIAVAAALGCAKDRTMRVQDRPLAAALASERPTVPAGTDFTVALNDGLATSLHTPESVFTAIVTRPIMTPRGEVLVPKGAILRGRVVAVEHAPTPTLRLAFDSIDTTHGLAPISAQITEDQAGFTVATEEADPSVTGWDSAIQAPALGPGMGGGPPDEARELVLPAGTELKLRLGAPLRAPQR